jgi:uncharacterized surface protein with fasciclin (FAS1) repeats
MKSESGMELQAQVYKNGVYKVATKKSSATIIKTDVLGGNVVIHAIDALLE